MKPIDARIAYYLRKVAELGSYHPARAVLPPWYDGRHKRLMQYKAAMYRRIEAALTPKLRPDKNGQVAVIGGKHIGMFFRSYVPYEVALTFVREQAAAVKDAHTIVKLHNRKSLRKYILERDGYRCHYCGQAGYTVDHIVPRSKGGRSTPVNLVCACEPCNQAKADADYGEFIYNLSDDAGTCANTSQRHAEDWRTCHRYGTPY